MQDEHLDRDGQAEAQQARPDTPPAPQGAPAPPSGRSVWPVILGVLALVFGLAGLLSNLLGAVVPIFLEGFVSSLTGELSGEAEETVRATMEVTRIWRSWTIGLGLIGALVSGLLFVGGILLLMQRAVSLQLLKVWALARMVMVVVAAFVGFRVQQQTFEALRSTMGAEMDQIPAGFLGVTAMFGTVFSLLFGWALPVFFLIWFARQVVKDEIDGWM